MPMREEAGKFIPCEVHTWQLQVQEIVAVVGKSTSSMRQANCAAFTSGRPGCPGLTVPCPAGGGVMQLSPSAPACASLDQFAVFSHYCYIALLIPLRAT